VSTVVRSGASRIVHGSHSLGRLKKYSLLRPSGVDWLGDLPAHWRVARLKHASRRSAVYGANESADNYVDDGVRFLRTTDIDDSGRLAPTGAVRIAASAAYEYLLNDGDLLLSRSGTLGRSFVYSSEEHGACAYAGYLVRFVLDSELLLPRFVFYFTKSRVFFDWLGLSVIQSTIGNVNGQKYANMPVPVPVLSEQRAIVAFLDRETDRIDALIDKRTRLGGLLEEKRAALTTHTLIRGLDLGAQTRDPGSRHVPHHWAVTRLKFCIRRIEQGWSPQCENRPAELDEWGVLKAGCVNGTSFDPTENKALPANVDPIPDLEIEPGDILISRANTRELLGSAALVEHIRPRLLLCDKLYRLTLDPGVIDRRYLVLLLRSTFARQQMEIEATGASASMQNISQETIRNLVVPVPPLDEQIRLVVELGDASGALDRLSAKAKQQIDYLREYRTALITAAVTGKIDVRSEAA
jgi:type I restriction enzyme S subunit